MISIINPKIKTYLDRLSASPKKPQSYLFVGTDGAGKEEAVFYFISKIASKSDDSAFLEKIKSKGHPDVVVIEPETEEKKGKTREKDISISQVREMQQRLKFFSYELGYKFCVIKKANRLTGEAANSLLKFLEEPQANTFFILLANNLDSILPTIISRSAVLRFAQTNFPEWKEEYRQDLRQIFVHDIFERFDYAEKKSKNKNEMIDILEDWENLVGESLRKSVKEREGQKNIGKIVLLLNGIRETINRIQHSNANPRTAMESLVLEMKW
jgi:DNA polymerase III delta prime subunit